MKLLDQRRWDWNILLTERFQNRFWAKVEKTPSCWLWVASTRGRATHQYGAIRIGSRTDNTMATEAAHRVSWALENGRWPEFNVLHSCDVPLCVNPAHLREGTQADNANDMFSRGRVCRIGIRNGRARFTEQDIRQIRKDPRTQTAIAADYGVWQTTIGEIKRRTTWGHVT